MEAVPGATPTDAPSLDDRIAAKFGFGEPEAPQAEPQATPAAEPTEIADEADPQIEVEAEPIPTEFLELKHNGEVKKLPKDEVVNLAQKGFDYDFKMQRLNGDAQRLQSMAQAIQAKAAIAPQALDALAEAKSYERQLSAYKNVDWYALSLQDPQAAWQQKIAFDQLREAHSTSIQKYQQLSQHVQQADVHISKEALALENQKLLQRIPEWKDETRRSRESEAITNALTSTYGFAREELGGPVLSDHRVMAILRDATKYREAIAAKKSSPQGLPQVAKPGTPQPQRSSKQQVADIKRGLHQPNVTKEQRKALTDELIARKFGFK
jgi:hypothetical protein